MHISSLVAAVCAATSLAGVVSRDEYGEFGRIGGIGGIGRQSQNIPEMVKLQFKGLLNLVEHIGKKGVFSEKCQIKDVAVRREWSTLSVQERKDWINAVKCLAKLPPRTPASVAPGAKSRYDDFVVTHIQQTFTIHATGNFPAWHRYFTWAFEKALREECGYKGYQPYADWAKYVGDPAKSPIFDGSDSSLGSDGSYVPHNGVGFPSNDNPIIFLPPQNGGGCIMRGPFKDFKVNMGPCFPALQNLTANPRQDCLGYNPRCLRRDISKYSAQHNLKDSDAVSLATKYNDPASWNYRLNGEFEKGYLGVHSAGHFVWGGDPGGDFMNSPSDPAFWLHHGYIDRTWWIWQNLDVAKRTISVGGTITVLNNPPSRNATLDDTIDLGLNAGPITIRDAGSTMGAKPFCYIYV